MGARYRTTGPAKAFEEARAASILTPVNDSTFELPGTPRPASKPSQMEPPPSRSRRGGDSAGEPEHHGLGLGLFIGITLGLLIGALALLIVLLSQDEQATTTGSAQQPTAAASLTTATTSVSATPTQDQIDLLDRPTVTTAKGPYIVDSSPSDGAPDVPADAALVINFSEAMQTKSINPGSIVVYQNGKNISTHLKYEYSQAANQLRLTPTTKDFEPGAKIEVRVTKSVMSAKGVPLAELQTISFTIAP